MKAETETGVMLSRIKEQPGLPGAGRGTDGPLSGSPIVLLV